ncbi:hypothetical protein OC835_004178 [Tilletia horrida]|nr:hypothetical protein OC835_004178 [Tilletia horrida]
MSATLPWLAPLVNGIGVVAKVNGDRNRVQVCGLTYFDREQKWVRYDLDLELDAERMQVTATQVPQPYSMVSFDAVITKLLSHSIPQGRLLRIALLQPAHSLLLAELDLVRDQGGTVRAQLAETRQAKDKRKVDEMLGNS